MSDWQRDFDSPGDELQDHEYPDEGDFGDDDVTEPCPHCGVEICDDVEQCPSCGDYILHDTRALTGRPVWFILLGILGILATIVLLAGLL